MATTNDIELIVWNFVRNHYETQQNIYVPVSLKYILVRFAKRIIGCKMIKIQEDLEFCQLLMKRINHIKKFHLLFRASENEYSAQKFHEKCDDQGATLTIIESNWGNLFGGYSSKSWKSDKGYIEDKDSFLFLIKSDNQSVANKLPMTLSCIHSGSAIWNDEKEGPCFGGHDICIQDKCINAISNDYQINYCRPHRYENPVVTNLCGGNVSREKNYGKAFMFEVVDYEVYSVQ